MSEEEKRNNLRVDFEVQSTVWFNDIELHSIPISNLSIRGVFLKSDTKPELGTHLRAKIDLPGTTEIEIELEGNVVRIEEEGFAIHFDSIDLESFTFLN